MVSRITYDDWSYLDQVLSIGTWKKKCSQPHGLKHMDRKSGWAGGSLKEKGGSVTIVKGEWMLGNITKRYSL